MNGEGGLVLLSRAALEKERLGVIFRRWSEASSPLQFSAERGRGVFIDLDPNDSG